SDIRRDLGNPNFDIFDDAQVNTLNPADPRISGTIEKYNNKVSAFLDFSKTLFMHQDVLDKMGYPELKSLALNGQDVRFADNAAVTRYINEDLETENGGKSIFDVNAVENHPLFQQFETERNAMIGEGKDPD